jgi:AraC-like DNA-binding protein
MTMMMTMTPTETPAPSRAARPSVLPLARLRRVTDYIQEHLDEDLRLAQLGSVVYMSPYHFARLFQHSTGLPPHRFVVRTRVDRAIRLLAARELPISRIARLVGFRTPSHFSTVFRRLTGTTPGAYRAALSQASQSRREGGLTTPAGAAALRRAPRDATTPGPSPCAGAGAAS